MGEAWRASFPCTYLRFDYFTPFWRRRRLLDERIDEWTDGWMIPQALVLDLNQNRIESNRIELIIPLAYNPPKFWQQ